MVEVKEAATIALQYFRDLYQLSFQDLALEEVEKSDDERYWYITLGYTMVPTTIQSVFAEKPAREYKVIKVDAETGRIMSMKIRKI